MITALRMHRGRNARRYRMFIVDDYFVNTHIHLEDGVEKGGVAGGNYLILSCWSIQLLIIF